MHDERIVEAIVSVRNSSKLQLLILLFSLGGSARVSELRSHAVVHGLRAATGWNISRMLSQMEITGWVSKHGPTWEVRNSGKQYLKNSVPEIFMHSSDEAGTTESSKQLDIDLSKTIEKLPNGETKIFLREVLVCLAAGANKAAIVMSWAAAMSRLQERSLIEFAKEVNEAAKTRLSTQKRAHKGILKKTDFEEIREADQLQLMMDAGMIGKTLKNQLIEKLNLRNACGHPNEILVDPVIARSHVQFLVLNVF